MAKNKTTNNGPAIVPDETTETFMIRPKGKVKQRIELRDVKLKLRHDVDNERYLLTKQYAKEKGWGKEWVTLVEKNYEAASAEFLMATKSVLVRLGH